MKPRLNSTRPARDLIKAHEPFLARAERRGRRWVVGYGHAAAAREGLQISREDAELLLVHDTLQADKTIERVIGEDLPAGARVALVSFACSVGLNAFKVSDVARLAKAGRHEDAAAALESWVRIEEGGETVISQALARRRAAEKAAYLKALAGADLAEGDEEEPAAPGPLVELIIEFIDPPAEREAPEPEAAPALPSFEEADRRDSRAETPEPAPTPPSREDRPEPAPRSEAQPETAEQAAAARESQAEAVRKVMARMSAQIARDVREGARPEAGTAAPAVPEADEAVSARSPAPVPEAPEPLAEAEPKLGFSYLKAGEAAQPLPPAPERAAKRAPKPFKAKTARAPRPARAKPGGARWFVTANLVIGLVLIAVGAWDVAVQADAYQAGILPWHGFGPVTFGIGVAWAALCVALMVRSRTAAGSAPERTSGPLAG